MRLSSTMIWTKTVSHELRERVIAILTEILTEKTQAIAVILKEPEGKLVLIMDNKMGREDIAVAMDSLLTSTSTETVSQI